jgi:hypothetical protein
MGSPNIFSDPGPFNFEEGKTLVLIIDYINLTFGLQVSIITAPFPCLAPDLKTSME